MPSQSISDSIAGALAGKSIADKQLAYWSAVAQGAASSGKYRHTSLFTMTTAATAEDVPSVIVSFTFDGRPVNIKTTPILTSQDQAASKLITLKLLRVSDGAEVARSIRQTDATANSTVSQVIESGPFTAWPSDGVPLVVGTTYQIKLNITSGSASKASINSNNQPFTLYVSQG